ncbi:YceI family protein [Pontibacter sp. JH31]|uniref:YceI family protein n=1 Tax=Pontibacter aquaedesilientis TaxID=2766980 RepID=A0ABR7XK69_9BACT|nr:YceI family protein [Pontibacter aquaedesilientis]MBD1398341.1 YceI family protein [Pontibacter aquaedesilientis]
MKKLLLLLTCLYWNCQDGAAQSGIYKGIGTVVFEAGVPLSLIKGTSEAAKGTIDLESGKFRFDVPITSFRFLNSLMHERFNDKYMQSHRFQKATFTGQIIEKKPSGTNGETKVTAVGLLTIHGVSKKRTITGLITQDAGSNWQLASDFAVELEDHHIKVPQLSSGYGANTMQVSLQMPLKPVGSAVPQIADAKKLSLK